MPPAIGAGDIACCAQFQKHARMTKRSIAAITGYPVLMHADGLTGMEGRVMCGMGLGHDGPDALKSA
jgi:hypothetical protein